MITWDLILCQKSFFQIVVDSSSILSADPDSLESRKRVMQHHIVISDNLVNAYKKYAKEDGKVQSFQTFMDEYARSTGFAKQRVFVDVDDDLISSTDIDDAIISATLDASLKHPLVICDKCEHCRVFSEKAKPTQTFLSPSLSEHKITNIILRNTAPFEVSTQANQPCSLYTSWLADIFHNEKEIVFFDRYMLNDKGFKSFRDHYLPAISKDTVVKIYIDSSSNRTGNYQNVMPKRKEELSRIAKSKGIQIVVYDFDHYKYGFFKPSYHDRRIFMAGYKIVLTKGIDFLPGSLNSIRDANVEISLKECNTSDEILSIINDSPGYYECFNSSRI